MKTTILLTLTLLSLAVKPISAQEFSKELESFDKILVSNRINATIISGDKYAISGHTENIELFKLNTIVKNGKLYVFLDDAKVYEKNKKTNVNGYKQKLSMYENDVQVFVTITCPEISFLEIRGEQDVICENEIKADKFKLRVYGEANVSILSAEVFLQLDNTNSPTKRVSTMRVNNFFCFHCFGCYSSFEVTGRSIIPTLFAPSIKPRCNSMLGEK